MGSLLCATAGTATRVLVSGFDGACVGAAATDVVLDAASAGGSAVDGTDLICVLLSIFIASFFDVPADARAGDGRRVVLALGSAIAAGCGVICAGAITLPCVGAGVSVGWTVTVAGEDAVGGCAVAGSVASAGMAAVTDGEELTGLIGVAG